MGQQRLVLWVAILASFVAFLDIAVVNVALPAIQDDLGGGLSVQQWVVDAYLITLGSLILIAGSLSDLFGRKKVLYYGLLGFAITSIFCAIAPSPPLLIIARALQGATGALLVPSSLAIIMSTFSGAAQSKAIGTWTAWTGISFIIGPLLGGLLIDYGSWRLIFAINVVPIAATVWLLSKIGAQHKPASNTRVDIVGSVLCAVGLGAAVYALIEQPKFGWGHPQIYLTLLSGLIIFGGFLWYERRAEHPMLPLSLFKRRNFSIGNIATLLVYAGLSASTFLLTVYLQQVGGYSALAAGMSLVPVTLLLFLFSSRFGALAGKYGPRLFMGLGPITAGLGLLLLLRVDSGADYWQQVLPGILIFGAGITITVAPLTSAILGDVEQRHAGIASAINNAIARVAGLVAIAAVGAIVAAQFASVLDERVLSRQPSAVVRTAANEAKNTPLNIEAPPELAANQDYKSGLSQASVSAFHRGILVSAGLMVVGGLISALWIRNPSKLPEPTVKAAAGG